MLSYSIEVIDNSMLHLEQACDLSSLFYLDEEVINNIVCFILNKDVMDLEGKGRYLTQSNDKILYNNGKKNKVTTQKTPLKCSIIQPFRTDLWRSFGATTATQLVWLNRFTGSQPSH